MRANIATLRLKNIALAMLITMAGSGTKFLGFGFTRVLMIRVSSSSGFCLAIKSRGRVFALGNSDHLFNR